LNTARFKQFIFLFLLLSVLTGLILSYTLFNTIESAKQCKIDLQQKCVLSSNEQQVSVQFMQAIELEEALQLRIEVAKDTEIIQMWVQGVNMYMGQHAVLTESVYVENNHKVYDSLLFLGACSETKMRWQLVIQTQKAQQDTEYWFYNFTTDRNKIG